MKTTLDSDRRGRVSWHGRDLHGPTTMPAIRRTIEALTRVGLRDWVKVVIGGAPVSQAYCEEIEGDGYAKDGTAAVVRAETLMGKGETP